MATYFVSSADGNDANSGLTLDLPWATLEYALESGGLSAGDTVMIRRTHSEIPTSDIVPAYDGTVSAPIIIAACPRVSHAISSADFTNGSTSVNVDDNDMDREKHQARYITGPDGFDYLITRVVDSATIILDREYAGSTASNQAVNIKADTAMAAWDAYDDSADTIKKTDWEADADDLPVIDFNDGNFEISASTNYNSFYCIEFKDSSDENGIIYFNTSAHIYLEGILLKQSSSNTPALHIRESKVKIKRSTFEGSGSGTAQRGLYIRYAVTYPCEIIDSSIYNFGDNGILTYSNIILNNVNVGVEIANGDDDITCSCEVIANNVKFGGTNGIVQFFYPGGKVAIENYGKILGAHRIFYPGGYYEKVAVSGETPNKHTSDYVTKITPNINVVPTEDFAFQIDKFSIDNVTSGSKTITVPIYNDTGGTLNSGDAKLDIFAKAFYTAGYDDTSEYNTVEVYSTETNIADAADADDWDSLTLSINPATTSKVDVYVYLRYYNATTNIFVESAIDIT